MNRPRRKSPDGHRAHARAALLATLWAPFAGVVGGLIGTLTQFSGGHIPGLLAGGAIGSLLGAAFGVGWGLLRPGPTAKDEFRYARVEDLGSQLGPSAVSTAMNVISGDVVTNRVEIGALLLVGADRSPSALPRQLPPNPRKFVNRQIELAALEQLLDHGDPSGGPVVVMVVGTPGVGTSAVSTVWAHQVSEQFVDGQLYLDLTEFRRNGGVPASDLVAHFLRALGVPDREIPAAFAERTALYRSATADKSLLILIDHVFHGAEITALVPSSPKSMVILTGHTSLTEVLVAGNDLIRIDPMTPEAAESVLGEMIGRDPESAGKDAVSELLSLCEGLPLALRACGAYLLRHSDLPIDEFVRRCRDRSELTRIVGLDEGGPAVGVFDLVYSDLSPEQADAYRLFGVVSRPELPVGAVAASLSLSTIRTRQILESLVEQNLIDAIGNARFRIHSLVHLHARIQVERDASPESRAAALHRVVGWYSEVAHLADYAIIPDRLRLSSWLTPVADTSLAFDSPSSALDWLELERSNLLECVLEAHRNGWFDTSWQLCESLWLFYFNRKHFADWIESHRAGLESARATGDRAAEARMLQQVARAHIDLREFGVAEAQLVEALELAVGAGHRRLEGSILEFIGVLNIERRSYRSAISSLLEARAIYEQLDSQRAVALQDLHLGRALLGDGQLEAAVNRLRSAFIAIDADHDAITNTHILIELGASYKAEGKRDLAVETLTQGIEGAHRLGLWHDEARAREVLGRVWLDQGDQTQARPQLRRAREIFDALGDKRAQSLDEWGVETA